MPSSSPPRITAGDLIATGAVALLALAIILITLLSPGGQAAGSATVYQNGEAVCTLDLRRDTEISVVGGYTNVITVRDGQISVTDSDCPGKDCVHCGWQSLAGRSVICMPNRMEIRLNGESDTDAEAR